ncbi:unnamed protein product [Dibothriocephalus latus]|uniref:Uncharacterized protein n=1 Tax=Dibothriocephalus latus TaxID=60516 RepID=A0A3P7N9Q8_DIBLA|nr:unnamed protein product [Dibothriocephalus latus]
MLGNVEDSSFGDPETNVSDERPTSQTATIGISSVQDDGLDDVSEETKLLNKELNALTYPSSQTQLDLATLSKAEYRSLKPGISILLVHPLHQEPLYVLTLSSLLPTAAIITTPDTLVQGFTPLRSFAVPPQRAASDTVTLKSGRLQHARALHLNTPSLEPAPLPPPH